MTNHAAEAESLARYAQATASGSAAVIALAQVHATLALAEQQRLSNLIAFMVQYSTNDDNASFIQYHGSAFEQITKGIGLFK